MTVRVDLHNALESWTSDGGEAFDVAEQVFDEVISVVRKRCPDMTLAEAELLLADVRRNTEDFLFGLLRNTLYRDTAVDVIAARFFGED
jgi:hypothetical protein